MADDMLTTTFPLQTFLLVVPARMQMFLTLSPGQYHEASRLESVMLPSGVLACGDVGVGKMPEPEAVWEEILFDLAYAKTRWQEGARQRWRYAGSN